MTATTTTHNGWGAFRFPVALTGDSTTAGTLDVGQAAIAGLLEQAIVSETGAAWRQLVETLHNDHPLRTAPIHSPVGYVCDVEPSGNLPQLKATPPILAVYRVGEPTTEQITLCYEGVRQTWEVDWILGPLDAGHQRKLGGFAPIIATIIRYAIRTGAHPDYNGGHCPFFGKFADIKVVGQRGPGVLQLLGADANYYGVSLTVETLERQVFTHGGIEVDQASSVHEFEQATTHVPYGTGDGTEFLDTTITTEIDPVD
jgi:hypothetical protein